MTTFTDIFIANGTPNQEQLIRANDTQRTADLNNAIGASGVLSIANLTCSGDVTANAFIGNGAALTGITGTTGGISNTGNTNIVADSDDNGSGVIALSIFNVDGLVVNNDASVTIGSGPLAVGIASAQEQLHVVDGAGTTPATDSGAIIQNNNDVGDACVVSIIAGTSGISGIAFGDENDANRGSINYDQGADTMSFRTAALSTSIQIEADGGVVMGNLLAAAASTDVNINGSNEIHSVTSSLRYKENVREYDLDLSKIMDIRAALYDFKEEYGGATEYGLPAEWLEEVFPEFVYKKQILLESEEVDENGDIVKEAVYSDHLPDSVQYSRLGSVLAIPVLQKIIQQLTAQGLFTFD